MISELNACRCFADGVSFEPGMLELGPEETRHLTKVRRMGVGSSVVVLNGLGEIADGVLSDISKNACVVDVQQVRHFTSPGRSITLVVGALKQSAWDELLQHAVELGVERVIRVQSEHAVSGLGSKPEAKCGKWRDRMIQACKQCCNPWLPGLSLASNVSDACDQTAQQISLLASLGEGARPLGQLDLPPAGEFACWVGPEGDFTDQEQAEIVDRTGANRITLGPRILRAETAALALVSCLRLGGSQGFLHDIALTR